MNKYKKLVFNTGIFAIGTFGSKILVLLLNRLYTANLSSDSMGIKGLLITAALFLQPIFTFALQEYLIRFGLDKDYDKREVFNTSAVMTAAGMALMTLVLPFLGYIPALDFIKGYTVLLLIYVVTSSFRMLCQQFVRALDKVKLFSIDGIFAALTLLVFNIIFISVLHWGVKGFMLATILSDLCSTIFLFTAAKLREYTGAEFFNKKLAVEMLRFAGPFIPTIVMWTITSLSDRLFINKMHSDYYKLGKSAAGIYDCANVIPNLISMVSTIFYQAWSMSAISENSSSDRNRFYGKVYSAYEAMLFIAAAALLIIVKPVTSIFMVSEKYSEYATVYQYTPILIAAVVFMSLNQFLGSIYSATKHPKNSFWTALVACGVNLPMNFFLIPLWGIQGAAVATLLSYLICFWARIIDARYYVPFRFDGLKNLANTAILLGMCIMMIFEVKLYIVWMLLFAAVIAAFNYKALLITVNKLLKRN
ncbi:MAG: polysaccharide biosynthesis C-terminal domain-containing protein [Ruminococcus sp.]|uniref:polysaccharide biosynthesis C-terminal domain-containing protein n=1 Tax=Ruminococcus sp. TaxID=41978 RepID=UPI001B042DB6|nr:polysaccharide biosynthesis C-terminal domain-containing protein [Ruminococcus sp.]MBO7474195.1 polysaccharide biosynthesis C-terminal domain-containing protein [Ruminococcus sp.]